MPRSLKAKRTEAEEKLAAIGKVAARFHSLRPAHEVLTRVRAVPTCFIEYDHATRVGGYPIERFCLTHGPSNHGKTTFTLGNIKSFLARNHFACLVDAERTTPFDWVETMLGPELARHPGFVARRPESYESTIAEVRNFCLTIAEAKDKGEIDEDTSGIIVVDSIRKLVPKAIMKQIEDENEKGKDADPSRRAAQIKAAMNANWLDELTPLLERSGIGMNVIARETEDPDAPAFSKKFGTNYKVGGGGALFYDASIVHRIERASWVTKEAAKEGTAPTVYGERVRCTIRKTKVAGKDDKAVRCYFHTSNGVLYREGFDPARDVLELAERFGIVEKKGAHISDAETGERIGQGIHAAAKALIEQPERLADLEQRVRAVFEKNKPLEEEAAA